VSETELPSPFCLRRNWFNKQDFVVVSAEHGVSVEHRLQGMHRYVDRRGHVEIMATESDRMFIVVNVRATTEDLVRDISLSVHDNNHVLLTVFFSFNLD